MNRVEIKMARKKPWVHVIGTGTIGEPFIYLLVEQAKELGFAAVSFHKRTPLIEEVGKAKEMVRAGAIFAADEDKIPQFKELGLEPVLTHQEAREKADVIIDCTPAGNRNKEEYYLELSKKYPQKGFVAQGSEEDFGVPYVWTVNDAALSGRFIQTVSCNTHQLVCPINTLVIKHEGIENLKSGKFFIARRGSDISEDKLNPGVEAEPFKTKYKEHGAHQGYDAARVFKTLFPDKLHIPIHSQIIKVPTQYMHTMLFDIEVKSPVHYQEALARLESNPLIVFTHLKSSNRVFDRARNASKVRGRILNQTVFYKPSLDVSEDGTHIRGTCFTPQDGNALLSSVAAALWLLDPATYKEKMKVFDKFLFTEV